MVNFCAIATRITLSPETPYSTTWVGTLKPQYHNCEDTAGMNKVDSKEHSSAAYIRLQMVQGKAQMIFDMTGVRDANGFTTKQKLSDK